MLPNGQHNSTSCIDGQLQALLAVRAFNQHSAVAVAVPRRRNSGYTRVSCGTAPRSSLNAIASRFAASVRGTLWT